MSDSDGFGRLNGDFRFQGACMGSSFRATKGRREYKLEPRPPFTTVHSNAMG
jgi:hypothetical protein